MSRHLVYRDEHIDVIVGWDRPLQTFFGQVLQIVQEQEAEYVFECGLVFPPEPINSVPDLEAAMIEYLPDGLTNEQRLTLLAENIGILDANYYKDWTVDDSDS